MRSANIDFVIGRPVIKIPSDRVVNGVKLIELVGHELNSHYRSAMATRNYMHELIERGGSPLVDAACAFLVAQSE